MKDYRTRVSFEKAFKKAVINFDETKIWFEHKSKSYEPSKVCFVYEGKLKKVTLYKHEGAIEIWKNYFIEFLNTGNFDYNAYFVLYDNHNIHPNDINKVLKFPLCTQGANEFAIHSPEMSTFLSQYRHSYPGCGIKQVPKP